MHEVYTYIKELCKKSGLPVYDQKRHEGIFRHLVIREGVHTQQILVNLSYANEQLSAHPSFQKKRKELLQTRKKDTRLREHVTTFLLTSNNGLADVVRGQDISMDILRGEGKIMEELHMQTTDNKKSITQFQVSPFSFFQTNTW